MVTEYQSLLDTVLLAIITILAYVDFNFDKDIELLKKQNEILQQNVKLLEKVEQRLEAIQHK